MGADIPQLSPPSPLATELTDLHREVAALRQQGAIMLRLLSGILETLKDIRNHEDILEHEIEVVEKEIEQIIGQDDTRTGTCPACGAPLEHHLASGGDLRICPACGLSQFVDKAGIVRHVARPVPPPPPDAALPSPWVD